MVAWADRAWGNHRWADDCWVGQTASISDSWATNSWSTHAWTDGAWIGLPDAETEAIIAEAWQATSAAACLFTATASNITFTNTAPLLYGALDADDLDMATAILNVDHHGAVPYDTDATADIGTVINDLIADLGSSKFGIIYLPGRAYGLSTTIEVPKTCQGFAMIGNGGWYYVNEASGYVGNASRLLWTGANGGTMMTTASHGTKISGIAFVGYAASSGSTHTLADIDNPGIGLQLAYETGIGSGMMHISDCSFAKCDVGLQFGDADNHNCDQSVADMVTFYNCGVSVKSLGTQQIGNTVRRAWAMHTPIMVDFRGGSLTLDGYDFTSTMTTLAHVQLSNTWALLNLNNVKIDSASRHSTIIDGSDDNASSRCQINVNQLWHMGSDPTSPTIELKNHMWLNITNSFQLPDNLIKCTGSTDRRCRVKVRDSSFGSGTPGDMVVEDVSQGPWTLDWTGCTSYQGATIEDGTTGEDS